jgi:Fe-S-cluster containining protein
MSCLCLAQHANYRCQHSGACCTSNWPIHVEADRVDAIRAAIADGRLPRSTVDPVVAAVDLPPGASAMLGRTASGSCSFYDEGGRRCAIHLALGHSALPSACQHFPRRCLIERDAVFVSLSHYCPTVARMALDNGVARGIVDPPASLVGHVRLEGLDARDALPPLLRPGMLADLDAYHAWERVVVGILEDGHPPEVALGRIRRMTERVQSWNPSKGAPTLAVDSAARECRADRVQVEGRYDEDGLRDAFEVARTSVPEVLRPAVAPAGLRGRDGRWVAPRWPDFSGPLGRFLAAHAFGNWCAYLGSGLMTVVRSLDVSLAVVRVEAARLCAEVERPMDEAILAAAFRAADLLLVHLADPGALAAALDRS